MNNMAGGANRMTASIGDYFGPELIRKKLFQAKNTSVWIAIVVMKGHCEVGTNFRRWRQPTASVKWTNGKTRPLSI